ncbi:ferric reductase-like transmembrane domain-containing protein [Curtobacterium sp. MCBD17_040]|uniref:ferredoxin reductase family protein n=1 Tax=Curtobacterium sp. MCBD17_040 TaxID=2175674 RepID=UPI0015E88599|nr:ferric reductase-like transmembrane domain-containing protein [Curtobacterium sp. MCBD17_040]WIB62514.1 ferric reductase-like transmembrane domain-containing protein [Curtobacterium sp. MCBD17_040]
MAIGTVGRAAPTRRPTERQLRRRHRTRQVTVDLLVVAVWVSAAMALALWLTAVPVRWDGIGVVVTDLGIAAGLVGTDLVLVMIVLAARIPWIDRVVGHDSAMAVHRSLGKPSLYLLLAHAVLLVVGYALAAHVDVLAEGWALVTTYDVFLSLLAILAMIAVVVTSVVAVRRYLPYEGWHAVHLLSYVAVLIALPHQLSLGGMLAHGSWQRTYWILLYATAIGAIGWFRFTVPAIRSVRHRMVVEHVERIAPDVVSLWIRGRRLDRLGARGGQFLIWRFWSGETWWHAHPLSLSAAPSSTRLRITVRSLGAGSGRLATLPPGTRVSFAGPYGVFTERARAGDRIAVAASGIGVTPIRAFLDHLDVPRGAVTILLRARSERETYLWDEVFQWATDHGARVYTSIGPRGPGPNGWLAAADTARGVSAGTVWPGIADSDLYICGPDGWSDLVEADARRAGLPADRLHRERFDW